MRLLDDRSDPSLRTLIGGLLARAERADFAISRLRLDGLDLGGAEVARLERCRVLIGRLDAAAIDGLMGGLGEGPVRTHHLRVLREFFGSGRVEVRAAGVVVWNPDFSVIDGLEDTEEEFASARGEPPWEGERRVALVGAHYFLRPFPIDGVAQTVLLTDATMTARVSERFEELWEEGYDVSEVVRAALDHLETELVVAERRPLWPLGPEIAGLAPQIEGDPMTG